MCRRHCRPASKRENVDANQSQQLQPQQRIFSITSPIYDEITDLDKEQYETYDHPDNPDAEPDSDTPSPYPYQGLYQVTSRNNVVPDDPAVSNPYQRLDAPTTTNVSIQTDL